MPRRLQREIDKIRKRVLILGAMVEERVYQAIQAYETRDVALAERVTEGDHEIDQFEVDLEEECLKLLALYQPVASDLRYVVAILKMNNDLERIGDLAVNLAGRAKYLSKVEPVKVDFDFERMANQVKTMLKSALDALVNLDSNRANEVFKLDDLVDTLHRQTYILVEEGIQRDPQQARSLINVLSISKTLERIADLTTNIAEDVIYLNSGEIVRHKQYGP